MNNVIFPPTFSKDHSVIGIFGEQLATDIKNDILIQFSHGKSTYDLKTDVINGSGTVSIQDSNLLTVSTGTDADGSAEVESFNSVRSKAGHSIIVQFSALFTNPTAVDTHQWIGVTDGVDGYAIGFVDGELTITSIKAGVHTHINNSSFNGVCDTGTIDFTKLNVFRILYGGLGVAPITFEVLSPEGATYRKLHTIVPNNISTGTTINSPSLPIQMHVENTGNTTDCQIRSSAWQAGIMTQCTTCGNRPFSYPRTSGPVIASGIGTTSTPIAAFRGKATINGFDNKVKAILQALNFISYNGEGLVTVQLIKGPTLMGVEGIDYNFVDVDSINSSIEISTDVSAYTGGVVGLTKYQYPTTLGSKPIPSSIDVDGEKLGLFIYPGEAYVLAAQVSADTIDIAWSVNWSEQF